MIIDAERNSYLSSSIQNRTRQPELDLAKFIAIFMMIACHCGLYYLEEGSAGYAFYDMLGSEFTAPAFMVCMGIGTIYSQHNAAKELIGRGFNLLVLGYLLNFIRCTIPETILWFRDPSLLLFTLPGSFYMVDILQFAGCAMILLGLFRKWNLESGYQLFIGLLMAGAGTILADVSTGNEWLDAILGVIWGTNALSMFPLLNWFIYPAAGALFGELLIHCTDKAALYKRLLPIGAVGVALSYYLIFTDSAYYPGGNYYYMDIKDAVYGLCYPMLMFAVCYFITEKTGLGNNRFVTYSSRNLNTLYCISWVVILWILFLVILPLGVEVTTPVFTLLMVIVFVSSYALCEVWIRLKSKRKQKKTNQKKTKQ